MPGFEQNEGTNLKLKSASRLEAVESSYSWRLNPPNKYYKYNSQGSISQIIQAHILYIK